MKKLILSFTLAIGFAVSLEAQSPIDQYLSGTLTTPAGVSNALTWTFLLTTNRAIVHTLQLSSTATGIAQLYDSDNTNAPFLGVNYTNDTYWTRASYPTNYVTTYVSALTGTTNVFTNQGTFTYFVTNAANTNALSPAYASPFTANIAVNITGLNLTFARGICFRTTTNVNYAIGYTP
jgi:hypothetical protein